MKPKFFDKIFERPASFLLAILFSIPAVGGDATGVGHGDVLDAFLGATRMSLIEAARGIQSDGDTSRLCRCDVNDRPQSLCKYLMTLTDAQRDYCRKFLLATLSPVIELNTASPITPFEITQQPILDVDPQGKPRPVSAMTPLGPTGQITFGYDSIRHLAPSYLLALMGHEFGHKSKPEWLPAYVRDNESIGPFDFPGGGRVLMDSVGIAISLYATRKHFIGSSFSLQDIFQCQITEKSSGLTFTSEGSSYRLFVGDGFDSYETGVSSSPQDFYCGVQQGANGDRLYFRVKIHEEQGCQSGATSAERWTLLDLWSANATSSPVSVLSQSIPQWNPLCDAQSPRPMRLEYRGADQRSYVFEVQYKGSIGKSR